MNIEQRITILEKKVGIKENNNSIFIKDIMDDSGRKRIENLLTAYKYESQYIQNKGGWLVQCPKDSKFEEFKSLLGARLLSSGISARRVMDENPPLEKESNTLISKGKIKIFEPSTGEYSFNEELENYMVSIGKKLKVIPKDAREEDITEWVISTGEQLDGLDYDAEGRISLSAFNKAIKATYWNW